MADTDDGLLVATDKSWSIDDLRLTSSSRARSPGRSSGQAHAHAARPLLHGHHPALLGLVRRRVRPRASTASGASRRAARATRCRSCRSATARAPRASATSPWGARRDEREKKQKNQTSCVAMRSDALLSVAKRFCSRPASRRRSSICASPSGGARGSRAGSSGSTCSSASRSRVVRVAHGKRVAETSRRGSIATRSSRRCTRRRRRAARAGERGLPRLHGRRERAGRPAPPARFAARHRRARPPRSVSRGSRRCSPRCAPQGSSAPACSRRACSRKPLRRRVGAGARTTRPSRPSRSGPSRRPARVEPPAMADTCTATSERCASRRRPRAPFAYARDSREPRTSTPARTTS